MVILLVFTNMKTRMHILTDGLEVSLWGTVLKDASYTSHFTNGGFKFVTTICNCQ